MIVRAQHDHARSGFEDRVARAGRARCALVDGQWHREHVRSAARARAEAHAHAERVLLHDESPLSAGASITRCDSGHASSYTVGVATQAIARKIALALPAVREGKTGFAFSVVHKNGKEKGFAWVWQERVEPKKPRAPNPRVLAVRVRDETEKAMLIAGDPTKFFTEPHYNGFPAVLVRLPEVTAAELRDLLANAWRTQAPRELVEGLAPRRPTKRRR